MRIALIVDNPYRDLPGIVLVATQLCRSGATCYLVPQYLEWLEVGALAPDFALLTNLRGPRQTFARRLLNAGIKLGVLDTEGGVFPNLDTYGHMASPAPDVYGQVSCFCSWGPKLADYLIARGWYRKAQVAVTGAPRLDFYAARWRAASLQISAALDRYPRPIVLVNGSFPRANPGFQTPKQEIQSWLRLGFARDYALRYQRLEGQALRQMAALANHVAARFPHATVVYRPHPFERVATYDALLERRSNLHLVKQGTVDGWILRASVVIQRNSTTAIEAAAAGLPVLLPSWIAVGEQFESVEAVSVPCASQDELDQQLGDRLAGKGHDAAAFGSAVNQAIRDWFYAIDGAAHERVATAILSHMYGSDESGRRRRARRELPHEWPPPRSAAVRARIAVRKALGLSVGWSFRHWATRDPGHDWQRSERHFDATAIQVVAKVVGADGSSMIVGPAEPERDYFVPYEWGHAIVMRPVRSGRAA
ncbi:MAG: surface carbohydrate biosynthesis protein [Vicinamibacterales bacterium]